MHVLEQWAAPKTYIEEGSGSHCPLTVLSIAGQRSTIPSASQHLASTSSSTAHSRPRQPHSPSGPLPFSSIWPARRAAQPTADHGSHTPLQGHSPSLDIISGISVPAIPAASQRLPITSLCTPRYQYRQPHSSPTPLQSLLFSSKCLGIQ